MTVVLDDDGTEYLDVGDEVPEYPRGPVMGDAGHLTLDDDPVPDLQQIGLNSDLNPERGDSTTLADAHPATTEMLGIRIRVILPTIQAAKETSHQVPHGLMGDQLAAPTGVGSNNDLND
jgi:hypothetical protein